LSFWVSASAEPKCRPKKLVEGGMRGRKKGKKKRTRKIGRKPADTLRGRLRKGEKKTAHEGRITGL